MVFQGFLARTPVDESLHRPWCRDLGVRCRL
jgi:hypothetical protein